MASPEVHSLSKPVRSSTWEKVVVDPKHKTAALAMKRVIDLVGSFILLMMVAPFFPLICSVRQSFFLASLMHK